jgi:hypothetical protein
MPDNRNNSTWEEHKNQHPKQNQQRGSKEEVSGQQPQDHLNDGTNDLKNGDQSSNLGEPSEKASTHKPSKNSL